jgi:5-methylcytosine-specific restriction endonuclease McrA
MAFRSQREPDYEAFRQEVLNRDGRTCQMPFCDSRHALEVHHIKRWADHPSVRTNPENAITLCRTCHSKIYGKEHRYAPLFLRIISEK